MRRVALVVLAMALASCGASAPPPSAASDLRALARFVLDVHPRPHAYVDRDTFDALVEDEAAHLDEMEDATDVELGRAMHRVLAQLHDGHVAIALPAFQTGPLSLLPLLPKRAGDTFFVDASSPELPHGTALIAIDGEPIDALWSELEGMVLADGTHESARRAALERGFARHFHVARATRETYLVRVREPDGTERDVELDGVDRDVLATLDGARRSAAVWGPRSSEAQPWPFVVEIDETTVLLRMPSFGIAEHDEYRRRVDAIFAAIDPDATLVLDVRGNEGGFRTHGIAVLNHVLGRAYAQWARLETRVTRIPDAHRAQVSFPYVPEDALASLFPGAPNEEGRFVREGDPLASMMTPHGAGHRGRVVAFVDGHTNSAAVEMITALRAFRPDAELIGEETGGECGRHVGEMPVLYTTRALGAVVLTSILELTHVEVAGCEARRGHVPHRAVAYDEAQFLAGSDPYLDAL
ncbi:S41 family peptidase [Sandaracinus amylolyticus]|uniref:Peptidase, S41 family n=1 Tax=Sandaracinus amylolyticus TaxID=927083 RepID=A0A0F6W2R1_9BACT|nr:S41 family peptidase [Sandaracinus amylolyticus]AKF05930.1 Peptidase, S41 family [Sandaracinus amylolyticus]